MSLDLEAQLDALPGGTSVEHRRDGLWMVSPGLNVRELATKMRELGAVLSTMTATMLENGETEIIYHYWLDRQAINIKAHTQANTMPSIARIVPAANWIEREIYDLYSVEFKDHPHLVRLVRPPQVAQGFFREPGGAAGKK